MRRSGSWQTVWDDRILEIAYNDEDGAVTLTDLVENNIVRISQSSISRRCQKLAEEGLLRKVGPGTYLITDEGEAYLKGEYDAEAGVYIQNHNADEPNTSNSGVSTNGAN